MLLTRTSAGEPQASIEVTGPKFTIGRAEDCDLILDDEKVSRHHAYIETVAGQTVIHDLDSSNGTFVNGVRVTEPKVIAAGDTIRIGHTELRCAEEDAGATVVDAGPGAGPGLTAPSARPIGRSTIQRIVEQEVREELAVEEQRMRRTTRLAVAAAVLALVLAAAAIGALFATGTIGGSGQGGPSISALERATVLITGLDGHGNPLYIGSGSIVRSDGYILTNAHVGKPSAPGLAVEYGPGGESDPARLQISLFQGEAKPAKAAYTARPVAWDGYADVAVLKIVKDLHGKPASHLNLPSVPLGDSTKLQDGENVVVIGYPGVGGGFEGAINVSRGTVSGFQQEPHIPGLRAWIKTDAAIAHGNSGGLAANSKGRLIGIPSRIQCGSSLFAGCNSLDDRQGKIRPLALALPVIRAAETGRPWKDPYLVQGTGREQVRFLGWAASKPDASCRALRVPSRGLVAHLYAIFDVSRMTPGEDIDAISGYQFDESQNPAYNQSLYTWPKGIGAGDSCYWYSIVPDQGPGIYSLELRVGPSLRSASGVATVRLRAKS